MADTTIKVTVKDWARYIADQKAEQKEEKKQQNHRRFRFPDSELYKLRMARMKPATNIYGRKVTNIYINGKYYEEAASKRQAIKKAQRIRNMPEYVGATITYKTKFQLPI